MKISSDPRRLLVIALALLVLGVIFPFLMVTGVIKSTLTLNFLSYIMSIGGFLLGIVALAMYGHKNRR